ncbi:MAG: protein-glutamate O-methyltransferase CheR [Helicobacteraceae bacterium]|jgi:chemotaxis protein methyltransferase CheR|nr:protein-glutamate O-methyltransferase CheR [Helicobacteraceae bacterium]
MIGHQEITRREFNLFRDYVYKKVGISLADHKITLVQGRLSKRLRQLGLKSYEEYYNHMVSDSSGEEALEFINAISTNVTQFFRESGQWEYLTEHINEILSTKKDKKLRIWSAACSSGEEPYSIMMFLKEQVHEFSTWDIAVLATDISKKVLTKAMAGIYEEKDIQGIPRHTLLTNFSKIKGENGVMYQIKDDIKKHITFRMFNLVYDSFSIFSNHFDIIFCRNVMIYFDPPTQQKLISNYHRIMSNDGLLFVGHSESLTRNKDEFKLLRPSIYQKM